MKSNLRMALTFIVIGTIITAIIVAGIVGVYAVETATTAQPSIANYYATSGEIIAVNTHNDTVTVRAWNGHNWVFYGTDGWAVGDYVSLMMFDSYSMTIIDDVIYSVALEWRAD